MAENQHSTVRSSDQKEKVRIIDFQLTKGSVTEYTLEDGTIVRLTPQLNQVLMRIDESGNPILNPQGIPTYHFNFGIHTQVIPKDRTIYVSKPSRSPTSTPPSTMTA